MDVMGLPVHPLVVHAAVILVPLAAVAALLLVVSPRLRPTYGPLVALLGAAAAASALVARFSGEWFLDGLGLRGAPVVAAHTSWGVWAPWPALLLAIALPVFLRAARVDGSRGRTASGVAAAVTVAAALGSLVLIVLTGHSGATAVWG